MGNAHTFTENEHFARAMLLGLHYHHGNGDPIYYSIDEDGIPEPSSFISALTLKPIVEYAQLGQGQTMVPKHLKENNAWRW